MCSVPPLTALHLLSVDHQLYRLGHAQVEDARKRVCKRLREDSSGTQDEAVDTANNGRQGGPVVDAASEGEETEQLGD